MKNKKIVINSLALALGIGVLAPVTNSFASGGGIENSPKTYAAEEKVDSETDSKEVVDESTPIENDKTEESEELEGLEVAPEAEKQAVGSEEENTSITYKNYETEIKYSDELAYGDYRVDQEGVLGQYEGDKEIVAPVNKIMTVGTNKDLVERIKYNEKYSIEDPGTFDYTEHALKNIKTTNAGLQRVLYNLTEDIASYDDENDELKSSWTIEVNLEDGADISKDLNELKEILSNDSDITGLQRATQYDRAALHNYSQLDNTRFKFPSGINSYMNLWLLNERGELNKEKNTYVLNDVNALISDLVNSANKNNIQFFVNNNYKTPFVTKGESGYKTAVFLTKDLFDKIYPELKAKLNSLSDENTNFNKTNIIYVDPIFAEEPDSLKFNYSDDFKHNLRHFNIVTKKYSPNFQGAEVYGMGEDIENPKPNIYFGQKLNPQKIYTMTITADGYTGELQDNRESIKHSGSIFGNYDLDLGYNHFYYNIKNIPYFGDETLNFKEKKLIEGDGKKNVVLPFKLDVNGYIDFYKYELAKIKSDTTIDNEEKSKTINEFNETIKKLENIKSYDDFANFLNSSDYNEFKRSSLYNKQFLDFLNNDSWGDKISNYAIGNVDTKVEERDFKVIEKEDPTLEEGKTKVETEGVKGKKVTKITYKVNRVSGELTDPIEEIVENTQPVDEVVLVGTKEVTPAKPIEDIAKTTKTTNEVIKAKVQYEADEELAFEEQVVDKAPVDGEKEITTVSQSGKEDVVTEEVIKPAEDGKTRVGNKKVETKTNEDGSITTTTTIYDVDPDTGELVNPRSTSKTTMPATPIEDIAKTTKTTNEVIKAKVQYEADEELTFEEQVVDKAPVDGEKEITTVSQSGKEDVVTEDIIKEPEDGKTRVGNKKVETKTNEDGSITTTTTIYDVDPDTGELVNPRSTSTTIKKPQNELYEPEGADQKTNIGKPLKPEDFITNIKDLPEDTKFEFEEQPDFDKPGESKVKIVATYPDGTKDTVESKLTVNDVEKPSTSNKTNVTPNTVKTATTAAPTRTSVKAQTGGGVGTIGGLIVGLTAAASSIFKRHKK